MSLDSKPVGNSALYSIALMVDCMVYYCWKFK